MTSPALLHVLLPWVSGAAAPQMDLVGMLSALLATNRRRCFWVTAASATAVGGSRLAPLELVSKVLNLSIVGLILSIRLHMLEIPVGAS